MDVPASIRLMRLREAAAAAELDALLLTSDESIAYASGFRPLQFERFFAVVVTPGGAAIVLPRLDEGQVGHVPAEVVRVVYEGGATGVPGAGRALGSARKIGVEGDHLNLRRARLLQDKSRELVDASSLVMSLRGTKDEQEVATIRTACELVESVYCRLFAELTIGDVETEVNTRVEGWLRAAGAGAAQTLILFGSNAANPHATAGPRRLAAGDVVCADVSARVDGYWGDLTRCATVGPASAWARRSFELVRDAQAAAIAACRVGAPVSTVDLAQRRLIEGAQEVGSCLHGAGHGLGLAPHEPPFLVPGSDDPLPDRCVLAVEPGIYHPDHGGIRIEDNVLVTTGGPQMLSTGQAELLGIAV